MESIRVVIPKDDFSDSPEKNGRVEGSILLSLTHVHKPKGKIHQIQK
jgi:hypothetical protein